jgi:uncharacterized FlaG/YvyC family protein
MDTNKGGATMRLPIRSSCAVLIAALGFLPAACEGDREGIEQSVSEGYEETQELAGRTREQVEEGLNKTLEDLDKKIESLQASARDAGGDIGEEYKEAMQALEEKRRMAADQMKKLGEVAADQWQNTRDKAEDAIENLQEAYDDVASGLLQG